MTQDYIARGVQTQTTKLGLTKLAINLSDPIVDAVNANADALESAVTVVAVPGSATAAGKPNQIAFDATHIYVCISTNVWVRATLGTF